MKTNRVIFHILAVLPLILGLSSISMAHPGDDWHRREEERRRWEHLHRPHPIVYAPAPVVVAPPPPSPGISIVLPIEIR